MRARDIEIFKRIESEYKLSVKEKRKVIALLARGKGYSDIIEELHKSKKEISKEPRLCFIMENFASIYSGGRYLSYMIALAFREIGFNVTLYTNVSPDKIPYINDFKDYKQIEIKYVADLYGLSFGKDEYDIYVGAPTDGCVIAHREAMKNGKRFITFLFDVPPFMKKYSEYLVKSWVNNPVWSKVSKTLKDAELIITFSSELVPYIIEFGAPHEKIKVFTPPINSRVADIVEFKEKKNQIFSINRFVLNKHWDHLFKAVSMMENKPRIAVMSKGYEERIKRIAFKYGVGNLVDIFYETSDENKFRIMKESKLLINPSSYEGISMSMLEGLRCHTPVIMYDFPVMRSIVGENGVVYADYLDVNSLKEKIELLLNDKELYDRKVEEARTISLLFSFDNFVQQLEEYFLSSNLNVLIYNLGYDMFSGGVYYIDLLGVAIAMAGNNVTIITDKENKSESGINHYRLKRVVSPDYVPPECNYHVVISIHGAHMYKALEYAKSKNALFIPVVFEIPNWVRAYGFSGSTWSEANESARAYLKDILPKADRILTIGHECKKYLNEWIPETKDIPTYTIPAIVNDRYIPSSISEGNYICFIGRNGANKRIEDLIDAVALLGDIKKEIIIKYITPVPEPLVKKYAVSKNVNVEIYVNVSEEEKYEIIKQCSCLVSTATFDAGVPLPIIEAMLCKKPVIAFDIPNIRYSLGDSIEYVKSGDINELSQKIKMFFTDKEFREKLMKRANNEIAMKYTLSEISKSNVLNELIQPVKIGVNLGVLNEEKFIEACIRQYAEIPFITKIVITEAADRLFPKASKDGLSVDKTASIIKELLKEYPDKLIFEQIGWVDGKSVYQNRGIELLEEYDLQWMLKADCDEFYTKRSLFRLRNYIIENKDITAIRYSITTFWLKPYLNTTGSQWDAKLPRLCKFYKGMRFKEHNMFPVWNNQYVDKIGRVLYPDDIEFFSYETLKDYEDIIKKLEYYKKRDKNLPVTDTITDWKEGKPTQYTHGGGIVHRYYGIHPLILQNMLKEGRLCLEVRK